MIHVTHVMEATIGGTRRHLRDLLLGLDAEQFTFSLICANRRDQRFSQDIERFRAHGVRVHVIDMRRSPSPLHDPLALWRIKRILRSEKPDLVHTHSAKGGYLGRIAAFSLGLPVVHTPHVLPFEMQINPAVHALYMFLERAIARKTTEMIFVSKHGQVIAQKAFGKCMPPSTVIQNGIDAGEDLLHPAEESNQVIGVRARICCQKGQDVALDALPQIAAARPNVRLLIQGEGAQDQLRSDAKHLGVGSRVDFMEPDDDPAGFFERVRYVLIPSRWEGLPYGALEAMAARRPVVCSDVGGLTEVFRDKESALIVPSEAPDAIANATGRLLDDQELATRLAANARNTVVSNFRLEAMLDATGALYQRVMRG